jgi:hypothetical protein
MTIDDLHRVFQVDSHDKGTDLLQIYCIYTKFEAVVLSRHCREFSVLLILRSFNSLPFK